MEWAVDVVTHSCGILHPLHRKSCKDPVMRMFRSDSEWFCLGGRDKELTPWCQARQGCVRMSWDVSLSYTHKIWGKEPRTESQNNAQSLHGSSSQKKAEPGCLSELKRNLERKNETGHFLLLLRWPHHLEKKSRIFLAPRACPHRLCKGKACIQISTYLNMCQDILA